SAGFANEATYIPASSGLPRTQNRKRPPGSNWGQRWLFSFRALSRFVNAAAVPPDAWTRNKPEFNDANTIWLSPAQKPPRPCGASQMVDGIPPARSIRRNLFPAKKATD